MQRPLTSSERNHFNWMQDPAYQQVCEVLTQVRADCVRYVGGCVRDSLLGHTPIDIDVATTLLPEAVMEALQGADIRAIPTGLEHGTVTAVIDGKTVEITTLRRDVSTDGRRATVAYTEDWQEDAMRRDFRINALYVSPGGILHDLVGGMEDLSALRVCFIGDAEARIKEDYLRILRFFRFSARFSKTYDEVGLEAIAQHVAGMDTLSRERVGSEFLKILSLPGALTAVQTMQTYEVLPHVWDQAANLEAFTRLKALDQQSNAVTGVAALYHACADGIGAALRLSNKQIEHYSVCVNAYSHLENVHDLSSARRALYSIGSAYWQDSVLVTAARFPDIAEGLLRYKTLGDEWSIPQFPISGKDVIALGVAPGPDISSILKTVEARWIELDFPADHVVRQLLHEAIEKPGN